MSRRCLIRPEWDEAGERGSGNYASKTSRLGQGAYARTVESMAVRLHVIVAVAKSTRDANCVPFSRNISSPTYEFRRITKFLAIFSPC